MLKSIAISSSVAFAVSLVCNQYLFDYKLKPTADRYVESAPASIEANENRVNIPKVIAPTPRDVAPVNLASDDLNKKILILESRIDKLVSALGKKQEQIAFAKDEEESTEEASTHLNEEEFGLWLEEALTSESFDPILTEDNILKTEHLLEELAGVNLEEMRCGMGVCLANFIRVDGKTPDINGVIGSPPFNNEISTMPSENGLKVFFSEPGVSLSEIRMSASELNLREG